MHLIGFATPLSLSQVNLKLLVSDVLDLSLPLVKKGVELVSEVGSDVPLIVGDNSRIIQILCVPKPPNPTNFMGF